MRCGAETNRAGTAATAPRPGKTISDRGSGHRLCFQSYHLDCTGVFQAYARNTINHQPNRATLITMFDAFRLCNPLPAAFSSSQSATSPEQPSPSKRRRSSSSVQHQAGAGSPQAAVPPAPRGLPLEKLGDAPLRCIIVGHNPRSVSRQQCCTPLGAGIADLPNPAYPTRRSGLCLPCSDHAWASGHCYR